MARTQNRAGPASGGYLLTTGWTVRPAGKQVALSTLPLAARLTADRKSMLILQSGYLTPSLSLHDAVTGEQQVLRDSSRIPCMAWRSTRTACTSAAASAALVYEMRLDGQRIEHVARRSLRPLSPCAGRNFTGDVVVSPDGATLYAADLLANTIAVIDRVSGKLLRTIDTCRMPYRLLLHPSRAELLVTSWSDAEVLRHDPGLRPDSATYQARRPHLRHDLADAARERKTGLRLLVAASHTNDVYLLNARESGELSVAERLNLALTPRQPLGMTPSASGAVRRRRASLRRLFGRKCRRRSPTSPAASRACSALSPLAGIRPACFRSTADGSRC